MGPWAVPGHSALLKEEEAGQSSDLLTNPRKEIPQALGNSASCFTISPTRENRLTYNLSPQTAGAQSPSVIAVVGVWLGVTFSNFNQLCFIAHLPRPRLPLMVCGSWGFLVLSLEGVVDFLAFSLQDQSRHNYLPHSALWWLLPATCCLSVSLAVG